MKDLGGHLNDWHTLSCPQRIFAVSLLLSLLSCKRYFLHISLMILLNHTCREELDWTVTRERLERMETWDHQVHVATLVQQELTYVPVTINSI